MVNTSMTHVFKHPKFYRIPRDKKDQVISDTSPTGASERAPGPGLMKSQATSKSQAASVKLSNQPVQVSSDKHPSHSHKRQASSPK